MSDFPRCVHLLSHNMVYLFFMNISWNVSIAIDNELHVFGLVIYLLEDFLFFGPLGNKRYKHIKKHNS